jgi:hypothetical protein
VRERVRGGAVLEDAREADVVAADLQRHDLGVGRQRVELRRVGRTWCDDLGTVGAPRDK